MKRFFAIFFFVFAVTFFFKPFFLNGLLPIPADTLVGLYYPYRDFYTPAYPRGVPFKNFLITDPVRQQIPWRRMVIDAERQLSLPLWNPYSLAGTPLLANFQSGSFYPFNLLFFVLPFGVAWSFLIVLEPLLGGLFLFFYLRNLRLHGFACLLGGITFAFSGFSVAWMEWGTIMHTIIWLPLVLLAKDKLLEKWRPFWVFVFFFSEVFAVFAGHLQVLFYALCISNLYLSLRIYQKQTTVKSRSFVYGMIRSYVPFLIVGAVMFCVTSVQWLPTLQFIQLSARGVDFNWHVDGWFIPWQHLVQFVVPDFFGNPATGNYWGVWNYGELVGYLGILPLLFVFFALFRRRDRKTFFWGSIFLGAFLFALPTFLAKLPFQFSLPFLSTAQPTRLLVVIDFSAAILAALGFDYYVRVKKGIGFILGLFGLVFVGLWILVFRFGAAFHLSVDQISIARHNLYLPTALIIISGVVFFVDWYFGRTGMLVKRMRIFRGTCSLSLLLLFVFLLITLFDLFRFAAKFETFSPVSYLFPQTKTLSYLKTHASFDRVMTTDSRILPPNFSDWYKIQSVDGYDPLYLLRYGALIAASERGKPDLSTPFGFNRIITPHRFQTRIINLLGVKYLVTFDPILEPGYLKVAEEGSTKIYENLHALPRVFFLQNVYSVSSSQGAMNFLFNTTNDLSTDAVLEGGTFSRHFSVGSITQVSYSMNRVSLYTKNSGDGFLLLTDSYYPTWHVFIDGKEQPIWRTDYAFRGVLIPKGNHQVVFQESLF